MVCDGEPEDAGEIIEVRFSDNGDTIEKACGYLYISPSVYLCSVPCLYKFAEEVHNDFNRYQKIS
jgi:hypothetical protein